MTIQTNTNVISRCEICDNEDLVSVLDLGMHPMCDDLVKVDDEKVCSDYPIEILFCKLCNTAHQKYQVPKHDLFPVSYHYRARFTADVLEGMKGLVDSCQKQYGSLENKNVLDIGCNDGSLLNFFRDKGANTIGIEPTGASQDAIDNGHSVIFDYLTEDVAEKVIKDYGKPDFITFTNVFAHIEDLKSVLRALNKLKHANTKIIIENHYLGAVLKGNQFDTFYHEHPRTYSFSSFKFMAKSLGLKIECLEFPSRYGGNIRVFMGNESTLHSSINISELEKIENNFFNSFDSLNKNIQSWLNKKGFEIDQIIKNYGPMQAKAFPGRAAILVKMLNLDVDKISKVYEKPGSLKIGHYLPGTKIPIHSDDELLKSDDLDKPILNLAWHISDEIENYLRNNNFTGDIVHILSNDDF